MNILGKFKQSVKKYKEESDARYERKLAKANTNLERKRIQSERKKEELRIKKEIAEAKAALSKAEAQAKRAKKEVKDIGRGSGILASLSKSIHKSTKRKSTRKGGSTMPRKKAKKRSHASYVAAGKKAARTAKKRWGKNMRRG